MPPIHVIVPSASFPQASASSGPSAATSTGGFVAPVTVDLRVHAIEVARKLDALLLEQRVEDVRYSRVCGTGFE